LSFRWQKGVGEQQGKGSIFPGKSSGEVTVLNIQKSYTGWSIGKMPNATVRL